MGTLDRSLGRSILAASVIALVAGTASAGPDRFNFRDSHSSHRGHSHIRESRVSWHDHGHRHSGSSISISIGTGRGWDCDPPRRVYTTHHHHPVVVTRPVYVAPAPVYCPPPVVVTRPVVVERVQVVEPRVVERVQVIERPVVQSAVYVEQPTTVIVNASSASEDLTRALVAANTGEDRRAVELLRAYFRTYQGPPTGLALSRPMLDRLAYTYHLRCEREEPSADNYFVLATVRGLLGQTESAIAALDAARAWGDRDASEAQLRAWLSGRGGV